jgi:hypothetical protein
MAGKTLPITWLHLLLNRISSRDMPKWIVRMDLGGKTCRKQAHRLFTIHVYLLELTGALSSSQDGSGERPHSSSPEFWEYDFYHFLYIQALLPHGQSRDSPYTKVTGKPADLSCLRAFGCGIY